MRILQNMLRVLDTAMERPAPYGWFHLLWFAISIAAGVFLCWWQSRHPGTRQRKVILWISVVTILLEVYKQINYSFSYENGIQFDYQWYSFPFQFCSTPMYIGLLAALSREGKVHRSAMAYLATFSLFAGLCVMFYPNDVFISTIGINIQTMFCHGSMVAMGIYLLGSGYVKIGKKTLLRAVPVFSACVLLAVVMNEIAYRAGLLKTETFNMFFVSPYCEPSLAVYSIVQRHVAFPWCLLLYIAGFTAAAGIILLVAEGVRRLIQAGKKTPVLR